MIKFTLKHYDALVRAETCMLESYDPNTTALVRHEFDEDFVRIHELKTLILFTIYNPELPYGRTDNDSDNTPRG